jgi:hypothetical protein
MKTAVHSACFFLAVFVIAALCSDDSNEQKTDPLPLPVFSNGGIVSLLSPAHRSIENKYGNFELLNYKNISYAPQKNNWTDTSWKLVALGNYLGKGIQYATIARLDSPKDRSLLILFSWPETKSDMKKHNVFYTAVLSKNRVLIRTKQSAGKGIDTLEFSCADTERLCGKCFYDKTEAQIKLQITDSD